MSRKRNPVPRTEQLNIRFTCEEMLRLKEIAGLLGLSVSQHVRQLVQQSYSDAVAIATGRKRRPLW